MNRCGFTKLKNVYCIVSLRRKANGKIENGKSSDPPQNAFIREKESLGFRNPFRNAVYAFATRMRKGHTSHNNKLFKSIWIWIWHQHKHIIHKRCITMNFIWLALKSSAINIDTDNKPNIKIMRSITQQSRYRLPRFGLVFDLYPSPSLSALCTSNYRNTNR